MTARVLVVEDNPANMKLATLLLRGAGHDVLQARTAGEAIAATTRHRPTLVLMDIQLPGVDGLAATRLLKADERTKDIPVLAVTAMAMRGDGQKLLAAGFDGYIAKPIRYKDFLREVERLIAASQGSARG